MIQPRTRRKLKSTNCYQREDCSSASQRETRARQVPQALPDHLDREDKKDPGDEEGRKEEGETKETKVLWDRRERAANKA